MLTFKKDWLIFISLELNVQFEGFSKVFFRYNDKDDEKGVINCKSNENYYDVNIELLGSGMLSWYYSIFDLKYFMQFKGAKSIKLQPGKHEYPFSVKLPSTVPSSFESKTGYIRHFCKAVLTPSSFLRRNKTVIKPLSVISISDLNKIPAAEVWHIYWLKQFGGHDSMKVLWYRDIGFISVWLL